MQRRSITTGAGIAVLVAVLALFAFPGVCHAYRVPSDDASVTPAYVIGQAEPLVVVVDESSIASIASAVAASECSTVTLSGLASGAVVPVTVAETDAPYFAGGLVALGLLAGSAGFLVGRAAGGR